MKLFSVGYESHTLDSMVALLKANEVPALFDVRDKALSRKPGFSKTKLSAGLEAAGIRYFHAPQVGNPKRDGQRGTPAEYTAQFTTEAGSAVLVDFFDLLLEHGGGALMCVEHDVEACHRSELIAMLTELGFPVVLL